MAVKVALFFVVVMCVALFTANRATNIPIEVATNIISTGIESSQLPWTYFVIMYCWDLISGSWMLWNEEARSFVYKKYSNSKHVKNIGWKMFGQDRKPLNGRKEKSIKMRGRPCQECDDESSCPNCIAKQVTRKKPIITLEFHF